MEPPGDAVVNSEIVVLNATGKSSFNEGTLPWLLPRKARRLRICRESPPPGFLDLVNSLTHNDSPHVRGARGRALKI
jgi:hypothetical protein